MGDELMGTGVLRTGEINGKKRVVPPVVSFNYSKTHAALLTELYETLRDGLSFCN